MRDNLTALVEELILHNDAGRFTSCGRHSPVLFPPAGNPANPCTPSGGIDRNLIAHIQLAGLNATGNDASLVKLEHILYRQPQRLVSDASLALQQVQ